jgi:DNA-directed RNA polymerase specialized sigma24 family protein
MSGGSATSARSGQRPGRRLLFEELSHAEIVRRLGISRNTVVSHMVTALAAQEREIGERERESQKK